MYVVIDLLSKLLCAGFYAISKKHSLRMNDLTTCQPDMSFHGSTCLPFIQMLVPLYVLVSP